MLELKILTILFYLLFLFPENERRRAYGHRTATEENPKSENAARTTRTYESLSKSNRREQGTGMTTYFKLLFYFSAISVRNM